jgi:hypothetical protein
MSNSKFLILPVLCVLATAGLVTPPAAWSGNSRPAQLTASVIRRPDPMVAYGKAYLVYELLLTNYDASEVQVRNLRIIDPGHQGVKFEFSGKLLEGMMAAVGGSAQPQSPTTIESGASKLVFVWLKFNSASAVPRQLDQFIGYRVMRGKTPEEGEIALRAMTVNEAPPLTIGPPLRGGNWLVGGGPSNTSYHRRAHMALDGMLKFAQRFAIDYVKVGPDGKTYSGDPKKNRSYYCYGADVIAVANGTVAAAHDGVPENVPDPVKRAVEMTVETAGGNYVALDIGYGRYALYAHLIPSSIKVKPGERVRRGQVLGRLGNSGNSTEPHLHFQISDAPSLLNADGLPYLYERVGVLPTQIVDAKVDPPLIRVTGAAQEHFSTMLLDNQVVVFPQ